MSKNKKNINKEKKQEKIIVSRTKEQRQAEIKPIIIKLTELRLNVSLDEIKKLFALLQNYVNNGDTIEIDIPIKSLNVRIRGILESDLNKRVWVKMECLVRPEED
jgi:hypothetical protein